MKRGIHYIGAGFLFLFSINAFADESIHVIVKTNTDKVMAIGYVVEGKKCGGVGKSYSGQGPKNKEYRFGYRKHYILSPDITCGVVTLSAHSEVTLMADGDKCRIAINN